MGQNIIKRIKQMVAKAESTDFEHEAEQIMEMVGRLMQAHGISLLDVKNQAHELDPVGVDRNPYGFYQADNWIKKLSSAAGRYYGVEVIWFKRKNWTETAICGRESCRAAYTAMMPYLVGQVRRLARQYTKSGRFETESKAKTQIGAALCRRLFTLYYERQAADRPKRDIMGMNMLVPVDEIELAMKEAFSDLKMVDIWKKPVQVNRAALEAANAVNLADQLKEKQERVLLK